MHPHSNTRLHLANLVLCTIASVTLASCVGYPTGVVVDSYQSSPNYGYGYAGPNSQSNYHYYPRYGTYYSPQTRQYSYQQGSSWYTRSSPYGVSANHLHASPYVPLNLHGSPSNHHSHVTRSYPSHWSPPASSRGRSSQSQYRPSPSYRRTH
jgi:hypothetical protein